MKNKSKIMFLGIIALMFATSMFLTGCTEQDDDVIKIGAIYPLSGDFAMYGIEYKRGLEMAAKEINAQGGILGKKVKIIIEDDQGMPERSVSALNKLTNINNVNYVFTAFSSSSQATAPIAQQQKIVYISATVSKIGGIGNYIFRDFWDIEDQGKAMGLALNQENISKLGILAMNFEDTELFINSLKSTSENTEFLEERFNFGDTDFKTQLLKFKSADVEGILVYAFPGAESIKITQQIIELELDNKKLFAGATTYGLPFMYEQFSETLEKMKVIDSWYSLDEKNSRAVEFATKYEERYGVELVGDAAYTYDGLYALKKAIESAGTSEDTVLISVELKKVELNGVAGPLSFDDQGNSIRTAYLQKFTENGWVKYNLE